LTCGFHQSYHKSRIAHGQQLPTKHFFCFEQMVNAQTSKVSATMAVTGAIDGKNFLRGTWVIQIDEFFFPIEE
jgi:hypothetical protein